MQLFIHNFPIKDEIKKKKNLATFFGQLTCKPFILASIVLTKSIFLYSPTNLIVCKSIKVPLLTRSLDYKTESTLWRKN